MADNIAVIHSPGHTKHFDSSARCDSALPVVLEQAINRALTKQENVRIYVFPNTKTNLSLCHKYISGGVEPVPWH
jgi:hypothetical protein